MGNVSLARGNNAREVILWLLTAKQNFQMHVSNYTTTIITEDIKQKFVVNKQSNRTFAAFSKIQADVSNKPVPNIDPGELIYFQHDFKKDVYIDQVVNIDLRSAYATILHMDGFISKETYEYLQTCNKQERLASVGMLASRKKIYDYKNGIPVNVVTDISPNAGIFFHAIKKTYEIMSELKRLAGTDYLFTWVDGIYFLPNQDTTFKLIKALQNRYFNYSVEVLDEFEVSIKRRHADVTFKKADKSKKFNLPLNPNEYARSVIETLKQNDPTYNHSKHSFKQHNKIVTT